MKKYTNIKDLESIPNTIQEAIALKKNPYQYASIGKHKTLVMLFFNASLRTRLSTEKAAKNLGMDVMVLNVNDSWKLEFEDGTMMNFNTAEHIKEAAQVVSQYADIIAVRAFPSLKDKAKDSNDFVLNSFVKYATVPVINMESAVAHPLQALADVITIEELKTIQKPKVVLSWAPHPKALPHSVANSFVKMMSEIDIDFSITHPEGYELNPQITKDIPIEYNQQKALQDADFVYVKNWSSYSEYGKILSEDSDWMLSKETLGNAKFMHCLPVRRNVVVEDAVLDSDASIVIQQANNRTYAAQIVLKKIIENLSS
ncbi:MULTISPECIES: N-acetylornithine carbamoyltransferase [unclassified Tenacibaculum]|uniref:N-acetylornithine carbamoyltransferase n=1 Tax=unclassified Tenacibaculum TaxID=2635139 RepID=UPI001F43A7CB|nr:MULTISPECIES: N-acetylornithine carbamoyltransferase [unclassified Tenacibaculum]MCF2874294.1 N-acetylornithine carbamoyltransferase [Tenacibaculum sp. Cn5-1]MCF2934875.1 N-acetylornithine carbamoyltransferase [Tenacibaculum sp. Cn5-34]MCG7511085.1 N-acetylornithine carbamoyltransferase [Tenacibaculum sp. Cn5-46]